MDRESVLALMLVIAVVSVPLLAVGIAFRNSVVFSPVDFINDGVDFALGLLAVSAGFWLSRAYGRARDQKELAGRTTRQLRHYLSSIRKILDFACSRLAKSIPESQVEMAIERDAEVLATLRTLKDWSSSVQHLLDEAKPELGIDKGLAQAARSFRTAVSPVLQDLATCADLRPDIGEVTGKMKVARQEIAVVESALGSEL